MSYPKVPFRPAARSPAISSKLPKALHDATRRADEVRQEALTRGISKHSLDRVHAQLNFVARQVREQRRNSWYGTLSTPESIQAEHARLMEQIRSAG